MSWEHSILAFYRGRAPDHAGRTIQDVWRFDANELERRHDFIQWLFPLRQPSRFNHLAPVLAPEVEAAFRQEPELAAALLRSLDLMLAFYGLERRGRTIRRSGRFDPANLHWLRVSDHNHLRLSRIMQSLALLGQPAIAESLRQILLEIATEVGPEAISPATAQVWQGLELRSA